jgi:hypothetical protein
MLVDADTLVSYHEFDVGGTRPRYLARGIDYCAAVGRVFVSHWCVAVLNDPVIAEMAGLTTTLSSYSRMETGLSL